MTGLQLTHLDDRLCSYLADPKGLAGTLMLTSAGLVFAARSGTTYLLAKRATRAAKAPKGQPAHVIQTRKRPQIIDEMIDRTAVAVNAGPLDGEGMTVSATLAEGR